MLTVVIAGTSANFQDVVAVAVAAVLMLMLMLLFAPMLYRYRRQYCIFGRGHYRYLHRYLLMDVLVSLPTCTGTGSKLLEFNKSSVNF